MIITINGKYTKEFLETFEDAYANGYDEFSKFCNNNLLDYDDILEIYDILKYEDYDNANS